MAVIKAGFNDKPLHIRVSSYDGSINVTVEQEGLKEDSQRYETLSYATIDELIALRDEINEALRKAVGV